MTIATESTSTWCYSRLILRLHKIDFVLPVILSCKNLASQPKKIKESPKNRNHYKSQSDKITFCFFSSKIGRKLSLWQERQNQIGATLSKDLRHFWLGYIRMLGHLQMCAHLLEFDRLGNCFSFCTLDNILSLPCDTIG